MSNRFKVAGVQMDVRLADPDGNRTAMAARFIETCDNGAALTVFPECTLSGYCFESLEEALPVAETVKGESCQFFEHLCQQQDAFMVYGFLEKDGEGKLFNSLNLIGPKGLVGTYRKIHLPFLGVDRFTSVGDDFRVYDIGFARVGLHICYDCSFPESGRCLALKGADILVLPTNWPPGAGATVDVIPNARALENHVYFMSANRIGTERDFDFVGKSKICAPSGLDIEFADHANPAILYAELDVSIPRQKKLVRVPGKHEIDRFGDRRPEKYSAVIAEKST